MTGILDVVRDVASSGTTVLYTTHYLEEAESLCDRVGILDHGKLLAEGTLDELKSRAGEEDLVTLKGTFDADELRGRLGQLPGVRVMSIGSGEAVLAARGDGRGTIDLLSDAFAANLELESISIQPPSLNSLFLSLTGRELRD